MARDVVVVVDHALGMKIARGEERQLVAGERLSVGDINPNDEARSYRVDEGKRAAVYVE